MNRQKCLYRSYYAILCHAILYILFYIMYYTSFQTENIRFAKLGFLFISPFNAFNIFINQRNVSFFWTPSLKVRARLHEHVSNFTSVWGNFIISVHVTSGGVKLTSVQTSLRSNWPKLNLKPQWVFHVNSKCPQWNKNAQNH